MYNLHRGLDFVHLKLKAVSNCKRELQGGWDVGDICTDASHDVGYRKPDRMIFGHDVLDDGLVKLEES